MTRNSAHWTTRGCPAVERPGYWRRAVCSEFLSFERDFRQLNISIPLEDL